MVRDDPRKLAKPLKPEHTVGYKNGKKTEVTTGNMHKHSVFNGSKPFDPCLELVLQERAKGNRKPKEARIDPFMVRQAKLKESNRG